MAVTVIDLRNVWDQADANTAFNTGVADTSEYIEAGASVSVAFNETAPGSSPMYSTQTAANLTDTPIYAWIAHIAILDDQATGGMTLYIGDGTNNVGFHLGGSDVLAFQHLSGPVLWQCFVVDSSRADELNSAGLVTAYDGSYASLDWANITRIGGAWITYSKALGGGVNCFVDIMRYGNEGIRIQGGTTGDRGTFLEMAQADRTITDGAAHGIIRELSTDVYGIQGALTFGDPGTGDSWFQDSGVSIIYEDRYLGDQKYKFELLGSEASGAETHFILSNSSIKSVGPPLRITVSGTGIDEFDVQNCVFDTVASGIVFATDTAAESHVFTANNVTNCGMLYPGVVPIRNCTFSNSTATSGVRAAVDWDDLTNLQNCRFQDNIYGIRHTVSGTVDYVDMTFTGNTYDILFTGAGTLTVQSNNSNPGTYHTTAGGTVSIINSVFLNLSVIDQLGATVSGAWCAIYDTGDAELMNELSTGLGIAQESYNYLTDQAVTIKVRKYGFKAYRASGTIDENGLSSTITMIADPQQS